MANGSAERHRHFILEGVTGTEPYRSRGGGGRPPVPARDRARHGRALRRQVVVSAGNAEDPNAWSEYPDGNDTDGVHDPAQAWNALTVGACIAVYPASGWWKTRPALERYDRAARYALIVGIKAPEADVDLYAEVASRIGAPVVVET